MNPAPPVTSNIDAVEPVDSGIGFTPAAAPLPQSRGLEQHLDGPNDRAYRGKTHDYK